MTVKDPRADEHAAALRRAIALRALKSYSRARDRVAFQSGDLSDLPEPPPYLKLVKGYESLIAERAGEPLESAVAVTAALDLATIIVADRLTHDLAELGCNIVSREDDLVAALTLLGYVGTWTNKADMTELMAAERAKRVAGGEKGEGR